MFEKQRVVVLGNGMAGVRFIEELLANSQPDQFDITVFGDEPGGNYNRILLSSVLAGKQSANDIVMNSVEWYARNGVTLRAGLKATNIDTVSQIITTDNGLDTPYDQLVIAVGSTALIPPFEGAHKTSGDLRDGIFTFRTLADTEGMIEYAQKVKSVAIIGGGLLGLEAAKGLMTHVETVHVVHVMDRLMETQLDAPAGDILHDLLSQQGMNFHFEKFTESVTGASSITGLKFADGSSVEAEMVVIAAGIRPNIEIASTADLEINRGIIVDDDLKTSASNIFAIGECAEHRGKTYGLVAPGWEQARVLAKSLVSEFDEVDSPESASGIYFGSKISTKLKVAGVDVAVMGDKNALKESDEVVTYAERASGLYKKLVVRNGSLAGAIVIGDPNTASTLIQVFDTQEELPSPRSQLLFTSGDFLSTTTASNLPDTAQICDCNGVTKGHLIQSINSGSSTLRTLCKSTRAGTGCGACKPKVQEILENFSAGPIEIDPSEHYYVPAIPIEKEQLMAVITEGELKSVSSVLDAFGTTEPDALTKTGLASLLKSMWAAEYDDERDARFVNDRVHANIQKDRTFSVIPRIFGGVTSPGQLRKIADVADKYDVPMVKVTGGQRIDLLGIKKEQLPGVWNDLGMPSGHAYAKAFRTCKTCVGAEFCRFGLGDSTSLGVKIEQKFQGIEFPHKVKLAVSGCPRNCAESTTKDIGAVAIGGGKWEIYVGGGSGSTVRKGDVLCTVNSHDEVMKIIGRFMQYYRQKAKWKERTYAFLERIGIDHVRNVVINDTEGIAVELDAKIEETVDAYVDPWEEGENPTHEAQFESVVSRV